METFHHVALGGRFWLIGKVSQLSQTKIYIMTEKPSPEKYGWEEPIFGEPGGWVLEGGEEAYYKALREWEVKRAKYLVIHLEDGEPNLLESYSYDDLAAIADGLIVIIRLEDMMQLREDGTWDPVNP